jgi:hypothetical protein
MEKPPPDGLRQSGRIVAETTFRPNRNVNRSHIMADRNYTNLQPHAHPVYFCAKSKLDGAFSDNRVFLIPPDDFDKADPTRCIARQDWDGPTLITIGPSAPDSSLTNASERYGIPITDLKEFRASQTPKKHGRQTKVRVTSIGTPPLSGTEAFAKLLAKEIARD